MSRSLRLTYQTAVVLLAVARGLRYGFDIIDASGLKSGTVYPVLRRLEDAGLLRSRWERVQAARDEQRPPRRYYELTASGRRQLEAEQENWERLSHAVNLVLRTSTT